MKAYPTAGEAPLTVLFTAEAHDEYGDALEYSLDYGNGVVGRYEGPLETRQVYREPGIYPVLFTVKDEDGGFSKAMVEIQVKEIYREASN